MFTNLIESSRKRDKRVGGTAVSVVAHVVLIGLAVAVTANAGQRAIKERREQDVKFAVVKPPPPPPPEAPKPPPPDVVVKPPPPKGFQVLTAPIKIPDKIPDVDLSKAVTNEADFSGKGVEGGIAKGVVGGKGPVNNDQPYFAFQVQKTAEPRPGNPQPVYPSMLESGGVAGEVLVQFVVDTSGRMEPSSFHVLKSTNPLFDQAVKRALQNSRFYPAEVGGRPVRQLVQQPFSFRAPAR